MHSIFSAATMISEFDKASKIFGLLWIGRIASSLENEIRIRNKSEIADTDPYQ